VNEIHAGWLLRKNAPQGEIRAKTSVNLLMNDFPSVKMPLLRRQKQPKLLFFG
jgi:hypothetical protein